MRGGGTRESEFFTRNPNVQKKIFFLERVGGGGGVGARVSEFFTKNPNLK